jgi:hypothetical protein
MRWTSGAPADEAHADEAHAARALEALTLDALLAGAARLRGARTGLSWSGEDVGAGAMTFGAWDAAASACADALADCGLRPGDAVLIVGAADPATTILIFGAARAGLEAALTPAGGLEAQIAARADRVGAAALLAPGRVGRASPADALPEIAAVTPSVRLAAVWGECARVADGLTRLDLARSPVRQARGAANGAITFFDSQGRPTRWRQDRLAAAALDALHGARIGATQPLVSTLAPTRLAGLVAGPLCALASGANLHLHAPFEIRALADAVSEGPSARLIAPGAIADAVCLALASAGVRLAGVLATREAPADPAPRLDRPDLFGPVVDLWRWGEQAVCAEPRSGAPVEVAPMEPRVFPLDEDEAPAFAVRPNAAGFELSGLATAGGLDWTAFEP